MGVYWNPRWGSPDDYNIDASRQHADGIAVGNRVHYAGEKGIVIGLTAAGLVVVVPEQGAGEPSGAKPYVIEPANLGVL